ncbi:hypothetical protein H0H92_000730 [Tricholoma furcatifolium]|nr:hypothetical protein H0H92_000730 [Tricholoma furcatifolium]
MSSNTTAQGRGPPTFPDDCQFDGTNYLAFHDRVLLAASLRGAEGYLDGSIEKPEPPKPPQTSSPITTSTSTSPLTPTTPTEWWDTNPSAQEWRVYWRLRAHVTLEITIQALRALVTHRLCLSGQILCLKSNSVRNTWTMALMVYNMKNSVGMGINIAGSVVQAWALLKEMYANITNLGVVAAENTLHTTKYADGTDFPEHVADLCLKWCGAVKHGILIASLPESWNLVVAPLQYTKTSTELIAGLNLHWEQVKSQVTPSKSNTTTFIARTSQKPRVVCTNNNCGWTGHSIENCYWPGGGKEGQFPPNFGRRRQNNYTANANETSTTVSSPPVTNLAHATPQTQITYALSVNAQFTPAAMYDENYEILDNYLSNVQILSMAYALRAVGLTTLIYADSGASEHCFVHRGDFELYTEFCPPRQGYTANKGGVFNIMGQGVVR